MLKRLSVKPYLCVYLKVYDVPEACNMLGPGVYPSIGT